MMIDPNPNPQSLDLIDPELAKEIRDTVSQYIQSAPVSAVAGHVLTKMSLAYGNRAPITKRLVDATLAMRQEYSAEMKQQIEESGQPDIHMGIVANKIRTVSAWLTDILTNGQYKIWTLDATPEPSLPADLMRLIQQRVVQEVQQFQMPPQYAQGAGDALVPVVKQHIKSLADEGAKEMSAHIEDKLNEAKFLTVLSEFIDDFAAYPYAVMSGISVRTERRLEYSPTGISEVVKPVMACYRVNPKDFYWSPDSTNCQNGEFVIEYASLTNTDLFGCRDLPGFVKDSIDCILGAGYSFNNTQYSQTHIENLQKSTYQQLGNSNRFPVIKYVGKLAAKFLIDHGISVANPLVDVEAEVWVVGDKVVRLVENPYPLGKRPYYISSYTKLPGAMVGFGLNDILQGVERMANAAARNLVKNMSYAAGPIGEVDEGRLSDTDREITTVTPYRIYRVASDPMGGQGPAFRFQTIPTIASELMAVYKMFSEEADRISGLNSLLLGQVDMASSSRTASGLSMLIANAAKVIKNTIGSIDRDIIEPLITSVYNWVLLYDSTFTGKVDAQVSAHGANGALQREMNQAKTVELLQLCTPYAQQGIVPPGTIIEFLRAIVGASGYNPDTLLPQTNASQMQMQNIMTAGQATGSTGNAPQPSAFGAGGAVPSAGTGDGRMVGAAQ